MTDREKILKAFGANLKRIRKQKGLLQLDVSVASGIETSEISRFENGKQSIELLTILKFASALDVPPGDLVTFDL